ncbi:MAG: hypothetical protein ACFFCP_07055 [Promethearchaeota archaeon]
MSGVNKKPGLLQELERTEEVLDVLLRRLVNLKAILEPIEMQMRVTDFETSGIFTMGVSRGIVCVLSGLIKGDPLERILNDKGSRGFPALIKASDRSESPSTVESIMNMVLAQNKKKQVEYIINLRWSLLPEPLEKEYTIIVGTRYISGKSQDIERLFSGLKGLGIEIVEDRGEYGGGPLAYNLGKSFRDRPDLLIMELTLSQRLSENDTLVSRILNLLATF